MLSNLRKLNVTVVNPLLLSFYDDFNQGAFGEEDFLRMLKLTESYVLRRSICDVGTNSLNKFLPSVIAKLNKVQDDGGDYARAFEAFLMLEAGTARRFPDNAEFFNALTTRNIYHYRKSFYLLSNLENHHHPKDPLNLTSETFSIEHVMPQNALASPGWELSSNDIDEEAFSSLVNNLGNLTLTAYNPELSDGSFREKKQRYIGGYGKDYLVISNAMRQADSWDADSIKNRAAELAHDAEARWPYPVISMAEAKVFEPKKPDSATERSAVFRTIFDAGLIKPGVRLFPKDDTLKTIATVTESGLIELPNGELFKSPSLAAVRVVALARGSASARNGWHFWKVEEDGPLLDELRSKYLLMKGSSVTADVRSFHMTFWDGFYDFCANSEDFTDFFGDPSTRGDNKGCWTSFGMGTPGMRLSVLLYVCPSIVGVQLHCRDSSSYARVLPLKEEFNVKWQDENVGSIEWDTPDEDKKSRNVQVLKDADYDHDDWNDLYQWLVTWLFKVRELALRANEDQHI